MVPDGGSVPIEPAPAPGSRPSRPGPRVGTQCVLAPGSLPSPGSPSFLRVSKAGTGATVFARHSARGRLGGSHLLATAGAEGAGARKASAALLWGTEPERSCCTYCDPVDLLLCASVEAATLFPGRFSLTLPPTEQRAPGRGVGGHGPAHAAFCIHGVSTWGGGQQSLCGVGRPSADAAGHDCGVESQLQRHRPRLWPPQLHQPGRSASGIGWVHMGVHHSRLKTRGVHPPPRRHLRPTSQACPTDVISSRVLSAPLQSSGGDAAPHGDQTAAQAAREPASCGVQATGQGQRCESVRAPRLAPAQGLAHGRTRERSVSKGSTAAGVPPSPPPSPARRHRHIATEAETWGLPGPAAPKHKATFRGRF